MFERLCSRPSALARHRDGPLAEERLAYLGHLADQGLSTGSLQRAAQYLLVIALTLRLAERPGEAIRPEEIRRQAARWAKRRCTRPDRKPGCYSRKSYLSHATRWLQFLGRLVPQSAPPSPFAAHLAAFADYMLHERGLSPRTSRNRCRFVRRFLDEIGAVDGSLRAITITQIDETLVGMVNQRSYTRVAVQTWATYLRAFFRYAQRRGWCRNGLADAIQSPRVFSQASVPAGPSWNDVRRLLATTEGDRPADIRDRAILMLLAVYGLRAGEACRLRLEDFDWERELLLVVCPKTRRSRIFPLCRPVGDAVLRYLQEVRPRSAHREVFLSLLAPIRPLSELWRIVAKRLRPLGLSLPHHGAHALRHACATHLLTRGLSLKEIGDHLGHQDPDTTRIYAKVDLGGLRQVADFDLGGLP
jgi:integrase/recombinase XerD